MTLVSGVSQQSFEWVSLAPDYGARIVARCALRRSSAAVTVRPKSAHSENRSPSAFIFA